MLYARHFPSAAINLIFRRRVSPDLLRRRARGVGNAEGQPKAGSRRARCDEWSYVRPLGDMLQALVARSVGDPGAPGVARIGASAPAGRLLEPTAAHQTSAPSAVMSPARR